MPGPQPRRTRPDWLLLGSAAALSLCGVLVNASAGGYAGTVPRWLLQLGWTVVGLGGALLLSRLDYRRLQPYAPWFYVATLLLLGLVLALPGGAETRRWLSLGPLNLQPAEPAKLAYILLAAWLLSRRGEEGPRRREYAAIVAAALIPLGLIAVQPDLATAFVFVPLALGSAYWSGIAGWKIAALLLPLGWSLTALTTAPAWIVAWVGADFAASPLGFVCRPWWWLGAVLMSGLWVVFRKRAGSYFAGLTIAGALGGLLLPLGWNLLKDYQQRRVLMFLDPTADPHGAGYNIIQSRIAIGSGGFWGKGFLRGSQGQLAFLPERHTDFAFSVWAEEWGFVGSFLLVTLYVLLLWRILRAAGRAPEGFGSLICYGVTVLLAFHAFFNIGMCLGLFPVAGLPLPFVSYGGSFMLTAWLAVGLTAAVERRSHELTL